MSDSWGSNLSFGQGPDTGGNGADVPLDPRTSGPPAAAPAFQPTGAPAPQAAAPPAAQPQGGGFFGSGFGAGFGPPKYRAPDPNASPLDQTADTLNQRIQRANQIATDPVRQFFDPEGVQKARDFVPKATEQLLKIDQQKATIAANRQQAETLGLHPGEVSDTASQADRLEVAKARALKGDLKVFQGLQAVDPTAAGAIADQVHEAVAGHLSKAQLAFDSLSAVQNQGQYAAKLAQLRKEGTLNDLEALGMKVPDSFDTFNQYKAREGQALREARISSDNVRAKLEERNTYQPMEEKEAKTYAGRLKTVYGDDIGGAGVWSRNASSNSRGLVINGAADPRDLGKNYTLASPDQRKSIKEEFEHAIPKEDVEKYRAFNRTYQLATTDGKGNAIPADGVADAKGNRTYINTNPNVQQGIAEGLASMLRGGSGGANVGLLKIELAKRGWAQGAIDGLVSNYNGALNTLFYNANNPDKARPYLSQQTQKQIRDVMDVLNTYNQGSIGDRASQIAERAGALGLDSGALGFSKGETAGAIDEAMKRGRDAQVARMMPYHQPIGGGDGVVQLTAQRPGAGAVQPPPGTSPVTQIPGAPQLQTPVQQAARPAGSAPQGTPPSPMPPTGGPGSAGGPSPQPGAPQPSPGPMQPITLAGQTVNAPQIPGASANYLPAMQRIESGNEKTPWTAGNDKTSARGAFQMIGSTWKENRPAGAPDDPRAATPQQQTEAVANLTRKNAAALQNARIPVNDTTLYMAHNLGAGGAQSLFAAGPTADARAVVGEEVARNNPAFFKGRPTVATVMQRYQDAMNAAPSDDSGSKPRTPSTGATATTEQPGLMTRISRLFMQGVQGGDEAKDKALKDVTDASVEHAPAIGSTLGAVGGSMLPGPGTVVGGALGGSGGQWLKDYIQGNKQDPTKLLEQGVLGGVLGVASEARPLLAMGGRVVGAGVTKGGAEAARGGDAGEVVDKALEGGAEAAGGEAFGRALGMTMHKVWSLFAPDAKVAVRSAAKAYSEAQETLSKETPKINGADNPAYASAEAAKTKAEQTLKDAGLKPEEAAYAHKVASEGVPKQEAEAARPGEVEKQKIGEGYRQLENEVGDKGIGAPKAAPKLTDGPIAAATQGKMSPEMQRAAERTEMAITAPAKSWQEKWTQLKDARSALLDLERDALTSTTAGRTQQAADYRTLANAVRTQQEKAAKYVFGDKDGEAFMSRLKVLDVRYRNVMEATNGGDLAKAAALKGDAGREAEKKFMAFAHDDPQAQAAYRAMRGSTGDAYEKTVPWTVAAEGIPGIGKMVKAVKLSGMLREWMRERTAGNPVKFADLVKQNAGNEQFGQMTRDLAGTAAQRGATMQ